ncbi:MAG: type I restriction endonuclease subunit S [Dinoroseobacter sp.]|nr:type I restriction endonuclease subunit S [Dinoroseobacter sp.]MAQ52436.1 type I restriction endonuclease subunit S [Pseudomonas sp.]MBB49251.1 type I restriction endonuclease subunit S [Pseudomonadales bacterium]MBB50417.1 type I restriction endonuclease subunit S [Pseudomonadales bacterium]
MSWPVVKLGDVAERVDYGLTASAKEDNEGPRFLRITDMQDDAVDWSTVPSCECSEKEFKENELSVGDIVFARTGATTGKSFLIRHLPRPSVFASYLIRVRPTDEVDSKYLAYFFKSPQYWFQITAMAEGAAQPGVNSSKLKELEIPLPPLPEQKRIAAILDKADAIRRKRQQAIQLADDFLRAVFLDMFGDPVTNPKGWELKTLGELCTKITDGEHGTVKRLESGRLYLMARNIDRKGNLDLSDVSYISEADHQRIYKRCGPEKGDVLLVCVGATIGKALVVPDIGEFSLARSVALLKPGKEIVSEYLLSLINTDALQRQFVSSGNSSAQAGLYLGKIKEIMVPVPGLKEQLRFKEIVNFVKEKFSSKINGGNLESDFVLSLSQKAFSGQL